MQRALADRSHPSEADRADGAGARWARVCPWLALVAFVPLIAVCALLELVRVYPTEVATTIDEWCGPVPAWFQLEIKLRAAAGALSVLELGLLALTIAAAARLARHQRASRAVAEASRQFAQATFDALPADIAILDERGFVLAANRAWLGEALHRGPDAGAWGARAPRVPPGANFLAACDAATGRRSADAAAVARAIRAVLAGRDDGLTLELGEGGHAAGDPEFAQVVDSTGLDASPAWSLLRVTRFVGPGGGRAVVLFEDITSRKRAEEQVRRAKDAADAASAAKSAFLANMSHEIRTPMTAILGYAEQLQDPHQAPGRRDRCVQVIRRNGEHLLAIINDILDLSKIEAGKLVVERLDADLSTVIGDVVTVVRGRADEKGLSFGVVLDGPVPRRVRTDPLRLKQVLINLLGNAVKFTRRGAVTLRVACHATAGSSILQFDVIDTGIGMDPDQRGRLFAPFTQGDESTTRRFGGTGLGLSISRRLAQLLGGDISVQSVPGEGTTFSVWLDAGQIDLSEVLSSVADRDLPAAPAATMSPRLARGLRVLLAEDGEDNRDLICTMLHDAGIEVTCAADGAEAVTMARAGAIDLVLMDMQMPELDGYTATRTLRQEGFTRPIVALTAHAMTDDRRRCIDAGCDEYLSKPVDRDRLIGTISRLAGAEARPPAAGDTPGVPTAVPTAPASGEVLRSSRADDPRLAAVLERFVRRLGQRVTELQTLLASTDRAGVQRAAHQLKGAAGGYGFPKIAEAAAVLEGTAKGAAPWREVSEAARQVIGLIRRVDGYAGTRGDAALSRAADRTPVGAELPVILVVDASDVVRGLAVDALAGLDVQLLQAADGPAAVEIVEERVVSVAIVGDSLGDPEAGGLLAWLRGSAPDHAAPAVALENVTRALLLTAQPDSAAAARAEGVGADEFVFTPCEPGQIRQSVMRLLERASAAARVAARSRVDALTGLPNARHLAVSLSAELSACRRAGLDLAVMLFEVEGMAGYNVRQGRPAGDAALRAAAEGLSRFFGQHVLARLEGDAFVAAMAGVGPDQAAALSGQAAKAASDAVAAVGRKSISFSTVTVQAGQHTASAQDLIAALRAGCAARRRSSQFAVADPPDAEAVRAA